MSRLNILALFAVIAVAGLPAFAVTVYALMPDDAIEAMIRTEMERDAGITFRAERFRKRLPFGVEAEKVRLWPAGSPSWALGFDTLSARLDLPGLLAGSIRADVSGTLALGSVASKVGLKNGVATLDITASGIDSSRLDVISGLGIKDSGIYSIKAQLSAKKAGGCPDGAIEAEGGSIDPEGLNLPGLPMLFKGKLKAALSATMRDCRVEVHGFSVNSKDMEARVTGTIAINRDLMRSEADLKAELMPKSSPAGAASGPGVLALFQDYKMSENYYSMRLKGPIGSPAVMR